MERHRRTALAFLQTSLMESGWRWSWFTYCSAKQQACRYNNYGKLLQKQDWNLRYQDLKNSTWTNVSNWNSQRFCHSFQRRFGHRRLLDSSVTICDAGAGHIKQALYHDRLTFNPVISFVPLPNGDLASGTNAGHHGVVQTSKFGISRQVRWRKRCEQSQGLHFCCCCHPGDWSVVNTTKIFKYGTLQPDRTQRNIQSRV